MRRENRLHSSGPEILLSTYHREAVQRVEAGTVHCTRTQHGQLRSAMHLVQEAACDDRLWRLWTNLFEHVPLTVRPLPSSRSEPDQVRASFDFDLVQRGLLMAFALPIRGIYYHLSSAERRIALLLCPLNAVVQAPALHRPSCGRERSARGLAETWCLSWTRQLSLEDTTRQMCSLQQLNCDRLELPAFTSNRRSTTLYNNTCKRPPPEGSFFDFPTLS